MVNILNYPNQINKKYTKTVNYANRGMDLEGIINETNEYLKDNDIALIYKKPTPIGIVDVGYENNKKIIKKGYFSQPSTLDYNGLYKGRYVEFEAKNTESKTAFPLANIHPHQINHIRKVLFHKGIVFLIIKINNEIYLLKGIDFIEYIDTQKRKSVPYNYIKDKGYLLEYNYIKGINYIDVLDELLKE